MPPHRAKAPVSQQPLRTTIESAGKPKLPGRLASPSSAGVTEGTRLLETEKPSDPRDRHAIFLQITDGQTRLELLQHLIKCHALFGEPARQRPLAHPKLLGDNARLCLAVRKQWGDCILDRNANLAGVSLARTQTPFAGFEQDFVQPRVGVDQRPVRRASWEI